LSCFFKILTTAVRLSCEYFCSRLASSTICENASRIAWRSAGGDDDDGAPPPAATAAPRARNFAASADSRARRPSSCTP